MLATIRTHAWYEDGVIILTCSFFSAGSLLLFDRNTVKFFRNDGYCWKKKKSGKIGEGHIKLKVCCSFY